MGTTDNFDSPAGTTATARASITPATTFTADIGVIGYVY